MILECRFARPARVSCINIFKKQEEKSFWWNRIYGQRKSISWIKTHSTVKLMIKSGRGFFFDSFLFLQVHSDEKYEITVGSLELLSTVIELWTEWNKLTFFFTHLALFISFVYSLQFSVSLHHEKKREKDSESNWTNAESFGRLCLDFERGLLFVYSALSQCFLFIFEIHAKRLPTHQFIKRE